jgi:PAS domain S-box-containing protein
MRLNRSRLALLPLVVGALSIGVTGWLWNHEQQATERRLKADFDFSVRQTASRIEQRMASYEQTLRGLQGLFRAADRVTSDRFDAYVDTLLAGADFAGVQFLAYAALSAGGTEGQAPITTVTHLAPTTGPNQKALGSDPYADPVRRGAMLLARDSGSLSITPQGPTLGDADRGEPSGFLMVLPVYVRAQPLDSVTQRRAALAGWVLASIRLGDLMSSLYGEAAPGIAVHLHDGIEVNRQTLMYESNPEPAGASTARFSAHEYIGFAGHTWTLGVSTRPAFERRYGGDAALTIAIAGTGLSGLLAVLTHLLVTGRARAHDAARAMTRELRSSEERYRRIVDTADEGIWLTDASTRTSFANPKLARLLGYRADEMLGRPLADFIGDSADARAVQDLATEPGASAVQRELWLRRKDGSPLWVSMATSPIVDAAGQRVGALSMVTDITGRKQADATRAHLEAQLRESQKMEAIGTLAGGIAHDFNNILASILGNAALAQQQAGADPATLGHLEQIRKAAVRARSLVQQILAFSRRQPHRLVNQPLRPLIEESVRLLRPILPAVVEFDVRLADTPMTVAADATQLQQVMLNLCTNAWHALNGRAGRIEIGLERMDLDADMAQGLPDMQPGACAHLWVSDNGCGMDETTLAHAFEPFFTTKAVGQGTGLGLSVVHGIMATHDGAITASSTPGRGSRFDLYFPLQQAQAAPAPMPARTPEPEGRAGQHVVYIDDDPVMVLMVQGLLQSAGYRVSCFEDPQRAIAALRAQPAEFDAVVTDYNMPGLSGLDVARELARIRPDLPVVMSSGYFTDEVFAAATQAGVRSLLQKEYTLEQLIGIVRHVLAEQPAPVG